MERDNPWILQDVSFGLGNFINLTPTIKAMSDYFGRKIPVYFDLDHIKQCFLDCPFMEILDERPPERYLFSSRMVDLTNKAPDYLYVFREVKKVYDLGNEIPHTYVDSADEIPKHEGDYTLFMYGSGNESSAYMAQKKPDKKYYQEYMKGRCVFTGSVVDYNRENWFNHMEHYLNDIRKSLALIRDAKLIVSNDTGLAHAAGALNKDMIILWRTSKLPKNGNPGSKTLIRLV